MGDDFILGAQWYSYDNGLTWQRVPELGSSIPSDATMTVVGVDYECGEITVRTDLEKVFGFKKRVQHALTADNRNALVARSICGERVSGPLGPNPSLPFEQRHRATCEACKTS